MANLIAKIDNLAEYLRKPSSRGKMAMLVYAPAIEREMVVRLPDFTERLAQGGIKVAVLDINHIVNSVLQKRLEEIIDRWRNDSDAVQKYVAENAGNIISEETQQLGNAVDVLIWARVGGAYPFLGVAASMEKFIGKLRATLVVLYPGQLEGKTRFRLLDLRDGYQYRLDFLQIVDDSGSTI